VTDRSKTVSREKEPRSIVFDRHRYTLRFRTVLPSTRRAISIAVARVLAVAREVGCARDERTDLEIALREALANAVIHGNRNLSHRNVVLRCYGAPREGILVAVRDEGNGFDPRSVPDPRDSERLQLPHGRGLLLMRELMDHAHHRKGGREVVLFKACVRTR
jgi:anti-sigma regulatory factor (Ser/Thr protein kinase)